MTRLAAWPAEDVQVRMVIRLDGQDTTVTGTCQRLDGSGRVPVWHSRGCVRVMPGTALAVVVDDAGEPVRAPELSAEQLLNRCKPTATGALMPMLVEQASDAFAVLEFLLGRSKAPESVVNAAARLADTVGRQLGLDFSGADVRRDFPTSREEYGNEIDGNPVVDPSGVTVSRLRAERAGALMAGAFPVRLMRRTVLQQAWRPVEGGE